MLKSLCFDNPQKILKTFLLNESITNKIFIIFNYSIFQERKKVILNPWDKLFSKILNELEAFSLFFLFFGKYT